jgi:signal transduction histidine kinase
MENLYKKIIDAVPIFFFLWDIDQKKTVFISEQFYHDRSKDYFVPDQPMQDLRYYVHEESKEAFDCFFENLSANEVIADSIELKAAGNISGIEWMELRTYPASDSGQPNYVVGHVNDMTSTKAFKQLLQSQVESLDAVTFLLAHELSSPVANIMGLADLLKSRVQEPDHQEYLHLYDTIYNFGGEILTLARGLVSLIELQFSRETFEKKDIPLKDMLQRLVKDFYHKPDGKKITIENKVNNKVIVHANPERLRKAVEEILVFLLKHIRKDQHIQLTAPTSTQPNCKEICIFTTDLDLPEKMIVEALNRSTRLNLTDVKGKQLSGMLELIIAKEITELHRGKLQFYRHHDASGLLIQLPD